jgi:predicted ArsR family transcriptional regulator
MTRRDQIRELLRAGPLSTLEVAAALGIGPHNCGNLMLTLVEEGAAEAVDGVKPYRWRLCQEERRTG